MIDPKSYVIDIITLLKDLARKAKENIRIRWAWIPHPTGRLPHEEGHRRMGDRC